MRWWIDTHLKTEFTTLYIISQIHPYGKRITILLALRHCHAEPNTVIPKKSALSRFLAPTGCYYVDLATAVRDVGSEIVAIR